MFRTEKIKEKITKHFQRASFEKEAFVLVFDNFRDFGGRNSAKTSGKGTGHA